MLLLSKPRVREGVKVERAEGGWVAIHPETSASVPLQDPSLLELLDGSRTLGEAIAEICRRTKSIDVIEAFRLVEELQRQGFLEAEEDRGGGFQETRSIYAVLTAYLIRRYPWPAFHRAVMAFARPFAMLSRAVQPYLAIIAFGGLLLWFAQLPRFAGHFFIAGDSYLTGLLWLVAANFILSLVGAVGVAAGCMSSQTDILGGGLGLVCCLPIVWLQPARNPDKKFPPLLHPLAAGPIAEGILSTIAWLAADLSHSYYSASIFAAFATVGFLRILAALCPWGDTALTRILSDALGIENISRVGTRFLFSRIWRSMTSPAPVERALYFYGIFMLVWSAAILHVLTTIALPALPALVADLSRGLPLADAIAAILFLAAIILLVLIALAYLGVFLIVTFGQWVVANSRWFETHYHLALTLIVVTALLAAAAALSQTPGAAIHLLLNALVLIGFTLTCGAAAVLYRQHAGGRISHAVLPLGLAAISAWLLAGFATLMPLAARHILLLSAAAFLGLFAIACLACWWRQAAVFVSLIFIAGAYAAGAISHTAQVPWLQIGASLATALSSLLLCAALAIGAARSALEAPALLSTVSAAVIAAALGWQAVVSDVATLQALGCVIGILLLSGLLEWLVSLWVWQKSTASVEPMAACETGDALADAVLSQYAALLGRAAARSIFFAAGIRDGATQPSEQEQPRQPPAQKLRTLASHIAANIGPALTRRAISAAYGQLPWQVAASEFASLEWLQDVARPEPKQIKEALARSIVFANLTPDQLDQVLARTRIHRWTAGATVTRAGEPATWLRVVLSGIVEARVDDPVAGRRTMAILGPGDTLGVEALLPGGTYAFDAVATTDGSAVALQSADLEALGLWKSVAASTAELASAVQELRNLSIFEDLAEAQVAALLAKATTERFEAGDVLIRQGEVGDKFYIIRSGSVEVVRETPDGPVKVATLGKGDCFGEMALLLGVPRTATVRATTPLETISVARDDFLQLIGSQRTLRELISALSVSRAAVLGLREEESGAKCGSKDCCSNLRQ